MLFFYRISVCQCFKTASCLLSETILHECTGTGFADIPCFLGMFNINKTALKYYQKVIKSDPQNYTAVKNTVLMARRDKNVKLEKKYLPLLVKCAETENERAAAQRRLDQINKK